MLRFDFRSLVLTAAFVLAACGSTPAARVDSTPAAQAGPAGALPARETPPASPLPSPTALAAPTDPIPPSDVPQATGLPLPTATFPPTDTPTPVPTLFPMAIQAMRAGSYPGSEIVIEQELDPGVNYQRYYASYLSDGLKIYGLLTVPTGDPPPGGWPAIVFNHGYIAPQVYKTTERYVAYVDRLARAGYIVYKIDYRGHDRSEGTAAGAYGSPGYTVDVLNALASLQRFPSANPQKIGMWGHSMGGYLTLRAMVISKDVRAGVIWSGVVASYPDLISKWRRAGPTPTPSPNSRRWRDQWTSEFGSPEQNPEFWASISATSFLSDLSGPLELHHSQVDEEVPYEFSESLAAAAKAAGQDVNLFLYPDDDHNLSRYFSTAMNETIAFFDQHLK